MKHAAIATEPPEPPPVPPPAPDPAAPPPVKRSAASEWAEAHLVVEAVQEPWQPCAYQQTILAWLARPLSS